MFAKEVRTQKYFPFLYIFSHTRSERLYVYAAVYSLEGSLIYLNDDSKSTENTDSEEIRTWFYSYMDNMVKETEHFLKIKVAAVMYECNLIIESVPDSDNGTEVSCYRFRSSKMLLNELQLQLALEDESSEYVNALQNFCNRLQKEESFASATELMLRFVDFLKSDAPLITKKIISYITPIHMAANYYHPKFKADVIERPNLVEYKRALNKMIFQYNYDYVPENASDEHSMYFNESQQFTFLFDKLKDEPIKFWETAKSTCPILPVIALQLLSIPASLRQLNTERIFNFTRKMNDLGISTEESRYQYGMTLLFNN